MASSAGIDFSQIQTTLDADSALRDKIREAVREVEKSTRAASGILNRVHGATPEQTIKLLDAADAELPSIRTAISELGSLIPDGQFWRYNDSFTRTMQQASAVVVLLGWARTNLGPEGALMRPLPDDEAIGGLVLKDDVISTLQIQAPLLLTTEEYLHSLISLINELSRLAVNSVTLGQFSVPVGVCRFCKDLSAGFGVLNLKNDSLRKRFDAIKYDVKRLEEVVYDITLRGLYKPAHSTAQPAPPAAPASAPGLDASAPAAPSGTTGDGKRGRADDEEAEAHAAKKRTVAGTR